MILAITNCACKIKIALFLIIVNFWYLNNNEFDDNRLTLFLVFFCYFIYFYFIPFILRCGNPKLTFKAFVDF